MEQIIMELIKAAALTRLSLTATQAFYLLVNNQTLPCPSLTILEIYNDNKDEDGFLYMTYASQEMFGK
uniref:Microtubule associated protein 1 light chain 3 gamma n=1 Tax=Laticauda laticaudata TaxID=8630 RepID=A0A8C5RYH7_LATLA